jgi:hypothetical protein
MVLALKPGLKAVPVPPKLWYKTYVEFYRSFAAFFGPRPRPCGAYSTVRSAAIQYQHRIRTMALSEPAKLYLLVGCLLSCLCTLFTSSSFSMGSRDLPVLRPTAKYCRKPKQALRKCLDSMQHEGESNKQEGGCSNELQISSSCEDTVARAYKHINMGGCSYKNQALALCEVEWCVGIGAAQGSCQQECKQARTELEGCIEGHVASYLEKYTLVANGETIKI